MNKFSLGANLKGFFKANFFNSHLNKPQIFFSPPFPLDLSPHNFSKKLGFKKSWIKINAILNPPSEKKKIGVFFSLKNYPEKNKTRNFYPPPIPPFQNSLAEKSPIGKKPPLVKKFFPPMGKKLGGK